MTLHQFYMDSMTLARVRQWRYGQALFNNLEVVRPDLASQVRATEKDPFYLTGPNANPVKWGQFISFIETEWRK